jgi:hypothetical protein
MSNKIQFEHSQQRKKELSNFYEQMYLSWFNDFLTIEKFAEFHNITTLTAFSIIKKGKIINHRKQL